MAQVALVKKIQWPSFQTKILRKFDRFGKKKKSALWNFGVSPSLISLIINNKIRHPEAISPLKNPKPWTVDILKEGLKKIKDACDEVENLEDQNSPHWISPDLHRIEGYARISHNAGMRYMHAHALKCYSQIYWKGEHTRHLCAFGKLRDCCNPEHLQRGNAKENAEDKALHRWQFEQKYPNLVFENWAYPITVTKPKGWINMC